jgi:hypothetical protein
LNEGEIILVILALLKDSLSLLGLIWLTILVWKARGLVSRFSSRGKSAN